MELHRVFRGRLNVNSEPENTSKGAIATFHPRWGFVLIGPFQPFRTDRFYHTDHGHQHDWSDLKIGMVRALELRDVNISRTIVATLFANGVALLWCTASSIELTNAHNRIPACSAGHLVYGDATHAEKHDQ